MTLLLPGAVESMVQRWLVRRIGRKPGHRLMLLMASNRPGAGMCCPDIFAAGSPQVAQPKNRWEEIRAASARSSGYVSSWDTIRQLHERNRMPSSTSSQRNDPQLSTTDDR